MKQKAEKSTGKRILHVVAIFFCVVTVLMSVVIGAVAVYAKQSFEEEVPIDLFRASVAKTPPKFYYYRFTDRANRQGEVEELTQGVFSAMEKPYVRFHELPKDLINAFVAIEDKRFYSHRGVDWYRTAAAGVTYVLGFSDSFGASTITQQTVKNVTGNNEITVRRKLQEILYALDLERLMEKSEILETYLNVISFGNGCIGVGDAADYYFSKAPQELTVAECATIAAITNNPSYYNPIRHPENTLTRRNLILGQMREQGYLEENAYREALAERLQLKISDAAHGEEIRSWYTDMVLDDVINDLCTTYGWSRAAASMRVHAGGLKIEVAMDPDVQKTVEEHYRSAVKTPGNANGESAQSAIIVIDSRTGDILGVAGAVGEKKANRVQNYATQTLRAPGSAIKPITVYAPALEKGLITWSSVYDDVPVNFGEQNDRAWPKNATGVYRGLTNIAYAVSHSTNTVSVRVLEQLGKRTSFQMAKEQFHLEHLVDTVHVTDCDVAALALGQLNYGITLRELTTAYTVFADGGSYHPWRSYYRVSDSEGNILLACPDASEQVISTANAAIVTKLLQGVVREGTSSSITLDRITECAGKTGTSQNDHDRLFVGYTPDLICGVWCGYEYPEPIKGANLCTGIWNEVMWKLCKAENGRTEFEVPGNVIQVSYCKDSGMLTDDACLFDPRGSRTQTGWFVKGSEPKNACTCHVLCHVDGENGGVSHGFCHANMQKTVGLIRVERHFPIPVLVSDAQYVWRGPPELLPPNLQPDQAYFEAALSDYCGRSHTSSPYNRSCNLHQEPPNLQAPVQEQSREDPDTNQNSPSDWNFRFSRE